MICILIGLHIYLWKCINNNVKEWTALSHRTGWVLCFLVIFREYKNPLKLLIVNAVYVSLNILSKIVGKNILLKATNNFKWFHRKAENVENRWKWTFPLFSLVSRGKSAFWSTTEKFFITTESCRRTSNKEKGVQQWKARSDYFMLIHAQASTLIRDFHIQSHTNNFNYLLDLGSKFQIACIFHVHANMQQI